MTTRAMESMRIRLHDVLAKVHQMKGFEAGVCDTFLHVAYGFGNQRQVLSYSMSMIHHLGYSRRTCAAGAMMVSSAAAAAREEVARWLHLGACCRVGVLHF